MFEDPIVIEQLCRICLKNPDKFVNIFDKNLAMRIVSCVSVEIKPDDTLPKNICIDCEYQLEKTNLFRAKSKDAENKLKRHQRLVNAGKTSNVFDEDDEDFEEEHKSSIEIVTAFEKEKENQLTANLKQITDDLVAEKEKLKLQNRKNILDLGRVHVNNLCDTKDKCEKTWKTRLQTLQTKFDQEKRELLAINKEYADKVQKEQKAFAAKIRKKIREEEILNIFEDAKNYFLSRPNRQQLSVQPTDCEKADADKSISFEVYQSDGEYSNGGQSQGQFNPLEISASIYQSSQDLISSTTRHFLQINGETTETQHSHEEGAQMVEILTSEAENCNTGNDALNNDEEFLESPTFEVLVDNDTASGSQTKRISPRDRKRKRTSSTENLVIIVDGDRKLRRPPKKECKLEKPDIEQTTYEIYEEPTEDLGLDNENVLDDNIVQQYSETALPDDTDSETFKSEIDYSAIEKAVKLTLAKSTGYSPSQPISLKYEKSPDDLKLLKVEVSTSNGCVTVMEFHTNEINKTMGGRSLIDCTNCDEKFETLSDMKTHAMHKHSQKGFSCDFCSRWCPTRSALERHTRTHTGEKPFACQECGKRFVQKEILKRHMTTHTGLRPYVCEVLGCEQRFIQKDLLKHHMNRKHTDNPVFELYKCYLCPKSFCHSSGLSRHLQTHAGKTFDCEHCARKFNDHSALKRHRNTIHANITGVVKTEG